MQNEITKGKDCRIIAGDIKVGKNVTLGDNVLIAGDTIEIGDNVHIGNNADIRASTVSIASGSEIGNNARILVADEFKMGRAGRISNNTTITCRHFSAGDFLYTADNFTVGYGGTTESTAKVFIGNRVALGPHNILNANCEIHLADKVGSGSYVTLWTHGFHFGHSILDSFSATFLPIKIDKNVWLGYHTTILPGVTIGENSIIAAGAMVASNQPADYLIGGIPAKPIKRLEKKTLTPREALDTVIPLLEKWAAELAFKGLEVETILSDIELIPFGIKAKQATDNDFTCIYLLPLGETSIDQYPGEKAIFISVSGRESWESSLSDAQTLFQLSDEKFHGSSNPISEDLRDFLRRHTLSCGFDTCYRSIEPIAFTRLKNLSKT